MSWSRQPAGEIQFGFQFPEYEFTEGEIVRLLREDLDHMPFIVMKRSFYDERSYRDRIDDNSPDHLYTGWYYMIKSLTHYRKDRYYTDAVQVEQLEQWKWSMSNKDWEA
jgi:hypothetical protein